MVKTGYNVTMVISSKFQWLLLQWLLAVSDYNGYYNVTNHYSWSLSMIRLEVLVSTVNPCSWFGGFNIVSMVYQFIMFSTTFGRMGWNAGFTHFWDGALPSPENASVSKHGQICGLVWHGSLFIQSHLCWMKLLPTTSPTRKSLRVLGETAGFVNTENGRKDLQLLHVRPRAKAALPRGEGRSREATRSSHPKRILHGCSAGIWRCGDA